LEREKTIVNQKSEVERPSTKKKRQTTKTTKPSSSSNSHWSPSADSSHSGSNESRLTIPLTEEVPQTLKTENYEYIPVTPIDKDDPSFEINEAKDPMQIASNNDIHIIEEAESSEDEAYSGDGNQEEMFETPNMTVPSSENNTDNNTASGQKVENEEDVDIDQELEEINKPKVFLVSEEEKNKTKEFFKQQTKKKLELVMKKKECLEGLIKMRKGECIKMLGEKIYKEVMDFFSDKVKVVVFC
jgi:hypothetical protein